MFKTLAHLLVAFTAITAAAKPSGQCELLLAHGYALKSPQFQYTKNQNYPVVFVNNDHKTLAPKIPANTLAVREIRRPNVVVVGAGPAGLTAAIRLAEAGVSVEILERSGELGGLASWGGSAYIAGAEGPREEAPFKMLGIENYETEFPIAEPIDSLLWNGRLYTGIFEEHTLAVLPASMALFKYALLQLSAKGWGDGHTEEGRRADKMNMADVVRQMPAMVKEWNTPEGNAILERFQSDERLPQEDPMRLVVLQLLNKYGRSALGSLPPRISARIYIDFYASELTKRFTGARGTGDITAIMLKKVEEFKHLIKWRTSTPVASIENRNGEVVTQFNQDGVLREIHSDKVIFSAPLTTAPALIKDLKKLDPEKAKIISEIEMTDYIVYVVHVKGHPFRATYDTWVLNDAEETTATDYILGRYQDFHGFEGMREFERDPSDDNGVIKIYHPIGKSDKGNFNNNVKNLNRVENEVNLMIKNLTPVLAPDQKIEVRYVVTYHWAHSIHIAEPGTLDKVPILARPVGGIHFANNNIDAPEFESAIAWGYEKANEVIELLNAKVPADREERR